jgi:hypothetical protein
MNENAPLDAQVLALDGRRGELVLRRVHRLSRRFVAIRPHAAPQAHRGGRGLPPVRGVGDPRTDVFAREMKVAMRAPLPPLVDRAGRRSA